MSSPPRVANLPFYSQSNLYWLICCSIRSSNFCWLNHVEPEFIHMDSPDFFSQHSSSDCENKPEISVSQTILGHFFPELTLSCLRFPAAKFERWNCTSNCARQIALWRVRMQQATPSQLGICFFRNISSHRSEFVPLDTLGIHVSKQKLKTTKIWHIYWMRWCSHKLGSMG